MPSKRTWTDEALRSAVASSTTYLMVMKALGLSGRGGSHYNVKKRVTELGIDTGHFTSAPNDVSRPWSDEQLRTTAAAACSYRDLCSKLGVDPANGVAEKIRRQLRALGISTAHFYRVYGATKRRRWTDEQLRDAVVSSSSVAQVIKRLGLIAAGGNYNQVQARVAELELDTSHFTGAAWSRGRSLPRVSRPLEEVLVKGSSPSTQHLKQRLFRAALKKPACEHCGWAQVRPCDGQIPVELDHINGDRTDNRLDNLRILCPNCHSLQPTHRGLNKRSKRLSVEQT